jgi:4-hydroxybenzoate polyprenyltransferase
MISSTAPATLPRRQNAASLQVLARALRVRQWTKNVLLFAGLLFAAKLGDPTRWGEALLAFAAYSAASSAAYLVNDVHDADRDRLHPTKRNRPVASGRLSPRAALVLAGALAAGALTAAATLGIDSLIFLAGFLLLQLAYSFRLKQLVLIDVLTISTLFAIRSAAGARAVDVRISPWLLACTALLALVALATMGTYCAYAFGAHSAAMAITIPFVAVAIGRYLVLVHGHGLGEEPEEILLTDQQILLAIGAWALTAALILTRT